jgi:hypothetical protein
MMWGVLALLWRLQAHHLMVLNEGSPTPDTAHHIDDVVLAQAHYGQVPAAGADFYRFTAAAGVQLRLSMLVPQHHYAAGFHPLVVVRGPGLPGDGLVLPAEDLGTRQGTTHYQRTQQASVNLEGGNYQVEVRSERAGVYCFCVGNREPAHYADAATVARVKVLLEEPAA